jgi:hypothetical protein
MNLAGLPWRAGFESDNLIRQPQINCLKTTPANYLGKNKLFELINVNKAGEFGAL